MAKEGDVFSSQIRFKMDEGEVIEGQILGVIERRNQRGQTFIVWSLLTEDGAENIVLSNPMFYMVSKNLCLGDIVRITYKGKEDDTDKMSRKVFEIELVKLGSCVDRLDRVIEHVEESEADEPAPEPETE